MPLPMLLMIALCGSLVLGYFSLIYLQTCTNQLTDFGGFYASMTSYLHHHSLYRDTMHVWNKQFPQLIPNLNPPFVLWLMLPLVHLTYVHAFFIWTALSISGMVFSIYLMNRIFYFSWVQRISLLALLLCVFPTAVTLECGQMSWVLCPWFIMAWMLSRQNHEGWSGFILGWLVAIKYFFAIFILYYLLQRSRGVLTMALGFCLLNLWTYLMMGGQVYRDHLLVLHHIQWYTSTMNHSFYGEWARWFTHHEGNLSLKDWPRFAAISAWISDTVMFTSIFLFFKKTANKDLQFAYTTLAMLLISPLGWTYYFVFLIPCLILMVWMANLQPQDWRLQIMVVVALICLSYPTNNYHAHEIDTWAKLLSGCIGFVGLFLLVILLWRMTRLIDLIKPNTRIMLTPIWQGIFYLGLLMPNFLAYANGIQFAEGGVSAHIK